MWWRMKLLWKRFSSVLPCALYTGWNNLTSGHYDDMISKSVSCIVLECCLISTCSSSIFDYITKNSYSMLMWFLIFGWGKHVNVGYIDNILEFLTVSLLMWTWRQYKSPKFGQYILHLHVVAQKENLHCHWAAIKAWNCYILFI